MEEHPNPDLRAKRKARSPWRLALYALLSIGTIVLISTFVFLYFYTDPFINKFLKGHIAKAFQDAYPSYSIQIGSMHYDISENRVGFENVELTSIDSSLSCSIAGYSVSGIGWFKLLWARGLVPNGFTGTILDARGIVVRFPQEQYELQCHLLHVSVPDSEVAVDSMELHPTGDDDDFFAGSKFRQTRFRLVVPHASVLGLACLELLEGKAYRTRSANIHDMSIDVLINKEKASARDTSAPLMPNEILASVEEIIKVDSVNIWNGALKYGERFLPGPKSAVIRLDSMHVLARGIGNHGGAGDTALIHARGVFMKSAEVDILMSIPVSSPEFSFQYSGSLKRMDLPALNSFLETAEQMRIKAGVLLGATFDINVVSGRASGSVRAVYKNLNLAAINKRTGSEKGIFDVIASFVANNIKLRTDNIPDDSGKLRIGKVQYMRQRGDPFFRFIWFSLRSGVGDVVGF